MNIHKFPNKGTGKMWLGPNIMRCICLHRCDEVGGHGEVDEGC